MNLELLPIEAEKLPADGSEENLWMEDEEIRQGGSIQWLINGTYIPDLVKFRLWLRHSCPWVLRQLDLTSVGWERRQQLRFATEGKRDYQMIFQYDGEHTYAFMIGVGKDIFSMAATCLIGCPTEQDQLDLYLLLSRVGGAAFDLVIARCRNPPYTTAAGLKYPELLVWTSKQCSQRLDRYSESLVKFYGPTIGGACCKSELTALNLMSDTDASSVERAHSVQTKLTKEVSTNKKYLPDMSAEIQIRNGMDTGLWNVVEKKTKTVVPVQVDLDAEERRKRFVAAGLQGPWASYLSVNAFGRKLTREILCELSLGYNGLTVDEKAHYVQMGQLARRVYEAEGRTYGSNHNKIKAATGSSSAKLPGGVAVPEGSGDDVVDASALAVLRVQRAAVDVFLSDARRVLEHSRVKKAERKAQEEAITSELQNSRDRQEEGSAEAAAWRVMGASSGGFVTHQGRPAETAVVITHNASATAIEQVVEEEMKHKTVEDASDEWVHMHRQVMACACTPLGKVPSLRRLCLEAERCVCSTEDGKLLRVFNQRYVSADRGLKKTIGVDGYKAIVANVPRLVCRFEVHPVTRSTRIRSKTAEIPPVVEHRWFQVCRMRETPIVMATFVEMERLPSEDGDGVIGLKPVRLDNQWAAWTTGWQVFASFLPLDGCIRISYFKLVVSSHKRVLALMPWRQRVIKLEGYDAQEIWHGRVAEVRSLDAAEAAAKVRAAAEAAAKARRGGRGGGGAHGRGGGGARGRGRGIGEVVGGDISAEDPPAAIEDAAAIVAAGFDLEAEVDDADRVDAGEPAAPDLHEDSGDDVDAASLDIHDMEHVVDTDVTALPDSVEDAGLGFVFPDDWDIEAVAAAVVAGDGVRIDGSGSHHAADEPHALDMLHAMGEDEDDEYRTPGAPYPTLYPAGVPVVVQVDTGYGVIKYYHNTKNLVAELPMDKFGERTHWRRGCKPSNLRCKGRPVGFAMAWLMYMQVEHGRDFLLNHWIPTFEERTAARTVFSQLGGEAARYIIVYGESAQLVGQGVEPLVVS